MGIVARPGARRANRSLTAPAATAGWIEGAHHGGDHAADAQLLALARVERGEVGVMGAQPVAGALAAQLAEQGLAIELGPDQVARLRRQATVDDQDVPGADAPVLEGIVGEGDEGGGPRVGDQVVVEVEDALGIVLRRGGEAGGDLVGEDRPGEGGR